MTAAKPRVTVKAGSSNAYDGLTNVITMAGTSADRTTHARYSMGYVDRYQVESSYRTSGLSRKIHDIPPYEMTREGRDWQADDKAIEKLEALERKLGLWDKVRAAMTAARLYGGALIVLGLNGDPTQPAPRPGADGLKYVTVLSRYQVSVGALDTDLRSPYFGQPTYYEMNSGSASVKIHPSRVVAIVGQPVPVGSIGFGDNQGFWGDPLLLSIEAACKNVDSSHQNIAALLSEAKVDTITMSRLSDNLGTTEGENLLAQRIRVAQLFQSMFNTRLLDGGSGPDTADKWETRQLSFAGLPDVVRAFQVYVAGVADIPYTRLFGESPGGLNATGDGQQTDFNKMIRSKQNTELRPVLDRIDEYLIPSALGSRPSDVYWEFAPLENVNPETAAKIEKSDAETVKIYADAGAVPSEVIAAMTRGRLIESGYWPGVEAAYEEADAAGDVPDIPEPDEPDVEQRPALLAANDALTDPEIDTVIDAVTEGDASMAAAEQPMPMAQTPFSAAEMKMHEAMMAATGASADETWARKMIPHHQGALDMSQIVLRDTQDAEIRRMAQKTIEMQTQDIAELRRWLETQAGATSDSPSPTGQDMPFAAAESKMKDAMMGATGGNTDQTWARKMIPHHQGALDMSRVVLERSPGAEIEQMAQKTIEMQTADIGELQTWLQSNGANAG